MNFQENYKRLFKGRISSNDAKLLFESVNEEEIDEGAKKYFGVFRRGGNMGQGNEKLVYSFVDRAEAKQRAKELRKSLSPGEKSYYRMTYIVKPTDVEPESVNEASKPPTDATIKPHMSQYSISDDPYDVAEELGKKYGWSQSQIEKAEKLIRKKYIK